MPMTCPVCGTDDGHTMTDTCGRYRMYRCPDCTVEFADPMRSCPDNPLVAALYEGRTRLVGQYLGWFHREFLAATGRQRGTLLDIGCGTGDFVAEARRHGYDAMGIDTDRAAIRAGQVHHGELPLLCVTAEEFLQRDLRRYDVVTFFEVLEHLEDPNGFIATVRGHLNAGGWIALSVPNNDSPLLGVYRRLTGVIDYPPHHLTRWSKRGLTHLLQRHGFEVVRLAVLTPSLTDLVSDTFRLRLKRLRLDRRLRMGSALSRMLRPADRLALLLSREGRGMFVLARLADSAPTARQVPRGDAG